jgi:hypothetical protein
MPRKNTQRKETGMRAVLQATDQLFGDLHVDWFLAFPGDRVIDGNPPR